MERRIREANAVVVLLSEASRRSEMLGYEIQTAQKAQKAAKTQGGEPRLLPGRLGFTGPLSEPLGAILDALLHSMWGSQADDLRVVAGGRPAIPTPPQPPIPLRREPVGGAVPLDSKF